jgi:FkbM family methyltransferase
LIIVEPDTTAGTTALTAASQYLAASLIPVALGRRNEDRTLHLCKHPRQSSLLRPKADFFARYHDGHKWNVVGEQQLATCELDTLDLVEQVDFIKLDTQGSELEILNGGRKILQGTLGLEIEVEFREMYSTQPLFGEVSRFLTDEGFDFIDFVALARWQRSDPNGLRTYLGELIHADALFLRSPEWVISHSDQTHLLHRALLVYFLYGQYDMMRAVLKQGSNLLLMDRGRIEKLVESLHATRVRQQRVARAVASLVRWSVPDVDLHLTV